MQKLNTRELDSTSRTPTTGSLPASTVPIPTPRQQQCSVTTTTFPRHQDFKPLFRRRRTTTIETQLFGSHLAIESDEHLHVYWISLALFPPYSMSCMMHKSCCVNNILIFHDTLILFALHLAADHTLWHTKLDFPTIPWVHRKDYDVVGRLLTM